MRLLFKLKDLLTKILLNTYSSKFVSKLITTINNHPLAAILLVSLLFRIIYLTFNNNLWWDSYVYINIGKFIFSGGQLGFWESFRPLIHPLLLGLGWKLNIPIIFFGKILDLFFSLIAIYLVYLIAKKIFGEKTALLSSLIFGLSPLFIMFTGLILTEPLAIVFCLLGTYFLVLTITESQNNFKNIVFLILSGIFMSLSFLTKFPFGIFFAVEILVIILTKKKIYIKIKELFFTGLGFALPLAIFLIFNYFHYNDPFEPLLSGSAIMETATWAYSSGIFYYFTNFFLINPLYLLFFLYIYLFLTNNNKKLREPAPLFIFLSILAVLAYFTYLPRKETRYLVIIVPFISILISYIIIEIYHKLKNEEQESKSKNIKKFPLLRPKSFLVICFLALIVTYVPILYIQEKPDIQNDIQQIITENKINGLILSSSPELISEIDLPVVPFSGMDYGPQIYNNSKGKYQLLLINNCDFLCAPNDQQCLIKKERFLSQINSENQNLFQKEVTINHLRKPQNCTYSFYLPKKEE